MTLRILKGVIFLAVRVRIRVQGHGKSVEVTALANAGAESDEPVIALPQELAEELGIRPTVTVTIKEFSAETLGQVALTKVHVELLGEHNEVLARSWAYPLIKPGLDEPALSDALIEELGIIIVHAKRGLWRHTSDPMDKLRPSVK